MTIAHKQKPPVSAKMHAILRGMMVQSEYRCIRDRHASYLEFLPCIWGML